MSVSKENVPVRTKSVADVENDDSSGVATAKPLHKKSWFWVVFSIAAMVIVLPVVVITAIRCRNQGGRDISARTPRPANTRGDIMMQQRSPLMPRGKNNSIVTAASIFKRINHRQIKVKITFICQLILKVTIYV